MTMDFQDLITLANIALMGITTYFLKQTMDRIKNSEKEIENNKDRTVKNEKELELVRQEHTIKHNYVTKEFGELRLELRELNSTIKELNSNMVKRDEEK